MGFILESTYSYIALTAVLVSGAFVSLIFFSKWERKLEQEEAIRAQQVLDIANKTLPYLRTGLSIESATQVAKIIFERTDAIAVALTDLSTVLAFSGVGSDHHKPGESILTRADGIHIRILLLSHSQRDTR
jgi:LytS/YehU family sensor histidine kinase